MSEVPAWVRLSLVIELQSEPVSGWQSATPGWMDGWIEGLFNLLVDKIFFFLNMFVLISGGKKRVPFAPYVNCKKVICWFNLKVQFVGFREHY